MAISYSQIASARRPEPVAIADEHRSSRPSHILIRAASGVANMIGRLGSAQVDVLPGASDQAVARAATARVDRYEVVKWSFFAQHFGGCPIR